MNIEQTMDTKKSSRKRPKLVWVISIFYIISVGWTILSFALIFSGTIPLSDAQKVYFDSQTILDTFLTIIIGSLNFIGAILLFMLRRYAYHCFLSAFVLSMLMTVYQIIFKNWFGSIGGPGLIGAVIGWLISIAIILYANKLIKNAILK